MPDDRNDRPTRELLNRIWQDYQWGKIERDKHTSDWEDWRKQYESEWQDLVKLQDDEDLNQWFYVPLTRKMVHRLECTCTNHFFPDPGQNTLGKVVPTRGTNPMAADMLQQVLHAKVDIELNPFWAYQQAFNGTLVEEGAVLKTWWERRDDPDAPGGLINRAHLAYIPSEHVVWDPYALSLDTIQFFVQEVWLTDEELWLRRMTHGYRHIKEITEEKGESDDEWRMSVPGPDNKTHRLHKLLEYWGPLQMVQPHILKDMHREGRHAPAVDVVATVYKNKWILRIDPNPYARFADNPTPYGKLPLWIMTGRPKRGTTYGYSTAGILRDTQRETNLMQNQRRQAVDMEMASKIFYDRTRVNAKDLYRARFGGPVPVDGPIGDVVKWFEPKTSTANMVQEKAMYERGAEELVGVYNPSFGRGEPGVGTATGMSIISQEGDAIQNTLLGMISQTGVVPVLNFFAECCLEYVEPAEVQEIIGSRRPPPPLKDLIGHDYRVEVAAGVSASSKQAELRNIQNATMALGQIANAAPQVALPAMMAVMPRYLRLLGTPEAAQLFEQIRQSGMQFQAPAAEQTPGMPNAQNEMAMAQQGRARQPEETPALPAGRGA